MENAAAQNANNADRIDALTAAQLLSVPADEPERLFTNDAGALKAEYRRLAMRWHPDRNKTPDANDVFVHLGKMFACAEDRIEAGTWRVPGMMELTDTRGKHYRLRYVKCTPFDYGDCYISRTLVTYVYRDDAEDMFKRAVRAIKSNAFLDDKLRKEFTRNLPQLERSFDARQGYVLMLRKDPDQVRLRDALDMLGGALDPRQAAWIMSGLYNLSCYLTLMRTTHNDIGPDTYFIGPQSHVGSLLGGWHYAAGAGVTLDNLPARTFDAAPSDVLRAEKADPRVDLTLIRLTGREVLGDPQGASLARNAAIPKALSTWLRMPTSGDAVEDFKAWETKVLKDSFGARRYVALDAEFSKVYAQKGGFPQP